MSYYTFYDNACRPYYIQEPSVEPPDVNEPEEDQRPSCICSKCGQVIWPGEHAFDGLCSDCFQEILSKEWPLWEIAEQLGYDVTLC